MAPVVGHSVCRASTPISSTASPETIGATFVLETIPPSVNANWRAGRGRVYKSAAYSRWYEDARASLERQIAELGLEAPLPPYYEVDMAMPKLDNRRRDLDNCVKATFDVLSSHKGRGAGVIEDDHMVERFRVTWAAQPGVTIRVTAGLPRLPALKVLRALGVRAIEPWRAYNLRTRR